MYFYWSSPTESVHKMHMCFFFIIIWICTHIHVHNKVTMSKWPGFSVQFWFPVNSIKLTDRIKTVCKICKSSWPLRSLNLNWLTKLSTLVIYSWANQIGLHVCPKIYFVYKLAYWLVMHVQCSGRVIDTADMKVYSLHMWIYTDDLLVMHSTYHTFDFVYLMENSQNNRSRSRVTQGFAFFKKSYE